MKIKIAKQIGSRFEFVFEDEDEMFVESVVFVYQDLYEYGFNNLSEQDLVTAGLTSVQAKSVMAYAY